MKFWITLEGRDAEVECRTEAGRVWLEVDGEQIEADFHPLPDGEVYSLIVNGQSHEVRVASTREGLEVAVHGVAIPVEVRHPLEKALKSAGRDKGAGGGETIVAPMPGVVVQYLVARGDIVAAGQAVVIVEAMKMQNELAARHGGKVAELIVAERASVAAGQPLLKLMAASGDADATPGAKPS